ncbi:MAG: hypothetical protein GX117_09595 [Candidatus Hydrogenedentes bacterium]|jgi:hypothetical protein|nr:hypothetical protein [Candidatus Hydrogenedentota bacterium]
MTTRRRIFLKFGVKFKRVAKGSRKTQTQKHAQQRHADIAETRAPRRLGKSLGLVPCVRRPGAGHGTAPGTEAEAAVIHALENDPIQRYAYGSKERLAIDNYF